MSVSILLFVLLGVWIDKIGGFGGIGVGICSVLGILCGGVVVYKILIKYLEK